MKALPIITEQTLDRFRAEFLSPETLFRKIPTDGRALLVDAPPGVGKTKAAHGLIPVALRQGYDLVVYVAPTRALLTELAESPGFPGLSSVTLILEPRPRTRCGSLDANWVELEHSGCAGLAKLTLCQSCPHLEHCGWVDQMDRITPDTRLVVLTEQYLSINPSFLKSILSRTNATNPLVILDEASFLTQNQTRKVSISDLRVFKATLAVVAGNDTSVEPDLSGIIRDIDTLLETLESPEEWPEFDSYTLDSCSIDIQTAGVSLYGAEFKNISQDLSLLSRLRIESRWLKDGEIHYQNLVDTRKMAVVIFSPYLPIPVVEERLGRDAVLAFEPHIFRHSESRFINILDPIGSLRTLSQETHFGRTCDFFGALLLKLHSERRRSVIVAKKSLVPKIISHLEELFGSLGVNVKVVSDLSKIDPLSLDCVVINYGILGVNSLQGYDAIFCIGGYYAREDLILETYWQLVPHDERQDLSISSADGRRKIVPKLPGLGRRYHARRAQVTLEMLERRVVLQAIGRVRPLTTPALVVLFQREDFSDVLGEVEVITTLAQARKLWGVPTRAEMRTGALAQELRLLTGEGRSIRTLAKDLAVSKSTVCKALHAQSLQDQLRGIPL